MRNEPLRDDAPEQKFVRKKISTVLHTAGNGLWSRDERAVAIKALEVNYFVEEDAPLCGELCVFFKAKSWDTKKHGLIYTDRLFLRELKAYLKTLGLPTNVDYSEQGMQGDDYVSLDVGNKFIKAFEKYCKV